MTRLLLAGTGLIGHRHLDHILEHPELELAGVIDPVPENRAAARAPGFETLADVDRPADGIVIATPTGTHAPLTLAALQRGLHVLVEKPVADTLENADAMIAAGRDCGRHVLVGHHRRYHPCVTTLKQLLDQGRVGRPVAVSLLWLMRKPDEYFDIAWRAGMNGGPVRQNLIHDVDMLRWLFGEVVEVTGLGSNAVRGAARTESGTAVLRFDSGVIVSITFADSTPTPWGFEAGSGENPHIAWTGQDCMRIACTEGAIEFPSLRVWSGANSWAERPDLSETEVAETVPLVRQLEHFADVIAGRADPVITARDARETLAVTLEIERATLPAGVSQ